jgi:hypothetical protein
LDDCAIETVNRHVTDDFEMFHDEDGRVISSCPSRRARDSSYDHVLAPGKP